MMFTLIPLKVFFLHVIVLVVIETRFRFETTPCQFFDTTVTIQIFVNKTVMSA